VRALTPVTASSATWAAEVALVLAGLAWSAVLAWRRPPAPDATGRDRTAAASAAWISLTVIALAALFVLAQPVL
jgi:hypothetical protein